MAKEAQGKKLNNVVATACSDNNFTQRLPTDATAVLNEEGVPVPVAMEIKVI